MVEYMALKHAKTSQYWGDVIASIILGDDLTMSETF